MPVACLYLRLSQDRRGEGLAVARQEEDCRALADRFGLQVGEVYSDNDRSASTTKLRPAFERMLDDVGSGKFQVILAYHVDRLYRRPEDLRRLVDAVRPHGVEVRTVNAGHLDLSTATGQANAAIFAEIAQLEVKLKAERQRRKELESAQAGKPRTSRRAFGFEPDGITWRQPEAHMVQQATVDVLAKQASLAEIVRRWNASGYLTAGKDRPWTHSSVREVLTRWRNAGLREHNAGDGHGGVAETQLYPGAWEPLVSREELEAVRRLLFDPTRRTSPGYGVRKHLLSFLLTCGECGDLMRVGHTKARTGNKYLTYTCSGTKKNTRGTNCRAGIKYEVVEDEVRNHVARRLAWPDEALLEHTAADRDQLRANHEARAEVEDRRRQINEADISDIDRLPMLARVKADLERLTAELDVIAQRGALAETMREFRVKDFEDPADDWRVQQTGIAVDIVKLARGLDLAREEARQRFDDLDLSRQRQIVEALVKVTILPAKRHLQYRGFPELTATRVDITDLDPRTGLPVPEVEEPESGWDE